MRLVFMSESAHAGVKKNTVMLLMKCSEFICSRQSSIFLFSLEKFFRKKNIQFSSRRFFSFSWNCTRRAEFKPAELVSCIIQVADVTAVRKLDGADSNPEIGHIFYVFFRYSLTRSYFLTTNIWVFFEKNSGFFDEWTFFLKITPFPT